jgi:predicted HAD superfamily Cof-like phosphohydrolase
MNRMQQLVRMFHVATKQRVYDGPPEIHDRELRAKLIMEEAVETVAALGFWVQADIVQPDYFNGERNGHIVARFAKTYDEPHLVDFIDGMCDLIYVVAGSAVVSGVDLDPHFDEVHRANMNKLQGQKRADGKQLKPEGWKPPDHERILRERADFDSRAEYVTT